MLQAVGAVDVLHEVLYGDRHVRKLTTSMFLEIARGVCDDESRGRTFASSKRYRNLRIRSFFLCDLQSYMLFFVTFT